MYIIILHRMNLGFFNINFGNLHETVYLGNQGSIGGDPIPESQNI